MDVKKVALLVGALVIAVITAVMAKNMFAGAGAQQAAAAPVVPVGPKVLVAKKALPAGTIIDPEALAYQPWPKELMQSAYYVEGSPDGDPRKLIGTVVRFPITAGQPVTRGSLVGPQDRGFLAAALGPGMRAVTVPVNVNAGVAGLGRAAAPRSRHASGLCHPRRGTRHRKPARQLHAGDGDGAGNLSHPDGSDGAGQQRRRRQQPFRERPRRRRR